MSHVSTSPELILDCKNVLGESILWDDRSGLLWWTNIHNKEVWQWDPNQSVLPTIFPRKSERGPLLSQKARTLCWHWRKDLVG